MPLKFIPTDVLTIRYKVSDVSGNVLADTTNAPDDADELIRGLRFADNSYYQLFYPGYSQEKCSRMGVLKR